MSCKFVYLVLDGPKGMAAAKVKIRKISIAFGRTESQITKEIEILGERKFREEYSRAYQELIPAVNLALNLERLNEANKIRLRQGNRFMTYKDRFKVELDEELAQRTTMGFRELGKYKQSQSTPNMSSARARAEALFNIQPETCTKHVTESVTEQEVSELGLEQKLEEATLGVAGEDVKEELTMEEAVEKQESNMEVTIAPKKKHGRRSYAEILKENQELKARIRDLEDGTEIEYDLDYGIEVKPTEAGIREAKAIHKEIMETLKKLETNISKATEMLFEELTTE